MNLVDRIKEKASANTMRIVLPEGDEPRTVAAAKIVKEEGLAEPVLLTAAEIAAILNIPENTVYTNLSRGRDELKEVLTHGENR